MLPDLVMERSRNDQKFQSASRFAVLPDLKKEKRLCSKGGSFNPLRGSRCFQTSFEQVLSEGEKFQSASRFAVLPDDNSSF